ncbi:MAG: hypothetical protein EB114_00290 [Betaproteobacteria bacterium]|nr:hypothetical protein [Betaproteobacteria bacterium]
MGSPLSQFRSLPDSQRGQILPLGLLLTGLLASLVFFFGRHALDMNRIHHRQNLADAAAFSAATWRARALNFNALANRALIAQEVYAAHLTEANAWSAYAKMLAERGQALSEVFPAAQPAAIAIAQLASVDQQMLRQLSELELFARTAPGLGLNDQLAAAQYAFLRSADGFGLSAIANEVVQSADRSAFAHTVAGDRFSQAWTAVETEQSKAQRRQLVWRSLQGGSTEATNPGPELMIDRRIEEQIAPIPTLNCIPKSLKQLTARLVRESSLEQTEAGWLSSQTLSLHGWRRGSLLPVCGERIELSPIAWSENVLRNDSQSQSDSPGPHAETLSTDPGWQNPHAQAAAKSDSQRLHTYQGAGRLTRIDPRSIPGLRHPLRVLVTVKQGALNQPNQSFAAAWVFHPDGSLEDAESIGYWLFPNWQARLSVLSEEEFDRVKRDDRLP